MAAIVYLGSAILIKVEVVIEVMLEAEILILIWKEIKVRLMIRMTYRVEEAHLEMAEGEDILLEIQEAAKAANKEEDYMSMRITQSLTLKA